MTKRLTQAELEELAAKGDTAFLNLPPLYTTPIVRTDTDGVSYGGDQAPIMPGVPLGLTRTQAKAWRRGHVELYRRYDIAARKIRKAASAAVSDSKAPTADELAGICAAIARDATVEPRARIAAVERLSKLLGFDAKPAVAEGPAYALQIVIPQGVTPPPVLAELQGETILMIAPATPEPTDDGSEF
jgi:hypothetical protein